MVSGDRRARGELQRAAVIALSSRPVEIAGLPEAAKDGERIRLLRVQLEGLLGLGLRLGARAGGRPQTSKGLPLEAVGEPRAGHGEFRVDLNGFPEVLDSLLDSNPLRQRLGDRVIPEENLAVRLRID